MALAAEFRSVESVRGASRRGVAIPARAVRLARLKRDSEVYEIARTVAHLRGVALRDMLSRGRGTARDAAARHLAMYLAHVLLGRPQEIVGALFGRDASTVSYACRTIEDMRDNPPLETEIERIEARLATVREVRDAA